MKLLSFYERIKVQFDVTEITIEGRLGEIYDEDDSHGTALGSACNIIEIRAIYQHEALQSLTLFQWDLKVLRSSVKWW